MKKIASVVLVFALCLLLTGCGKTLKCSSSSKQVDYKISTDYSIKSSGGIVKSVTIKQVITSKKKKRLEDFKSQLTEQYETNNKSYGGYKYKVNINKNTLTADVTIDYTKFNVEKFVKANGAMKEYVNKNNQLTLEGAKKMYKSTGAKCN